MARRRRRVRIPKTVDRLMVAFIAAGLTWMVLTSHYLRCPHTLALVISCVAGGVVIGVYLRRLRLRWQAGPVRISVGHRRRGARSRRRSW
jgi:hypothetical protein